MADTIKEIPLEELHPFPDHPFGVRDDDTMQQTVESVREYGVLVPGIARPREDGGFEIIAGHRRKHACELAGLKTMPIIVRDIDQNTASGYSRNGRYLDSHLCRLCGQLGALAAITERANPGREKASSS